MTETILTAAYADDTDLGMDEAFEDAVAAHGGETIGSGAGFGERDLQAIFPGLLAKAARDAITQALNEFAASVEAKWTSIRFVGADEDGDPVEFD